MAEASPPDEPVTSSGRDVPLEPEEASIVCKLSIPLPPGQAYMERVTSAHPESVFAVSGYLLTGSEVIINFEITSPGSLEEILDEIRRSLDVQSCQVLTRDPGRLSLRVTSKVPKVSAIRIQTNLGLLPSFPVFLQDGKLSLVVVAPGNTIRRLFAEMQRQFPGTGISSVRRDRLERASGLLTPHQLEIFHTALSSGYWDVPRRVSLTDLAGKLGLSKSTLSESLANIEHKLIREIADQIYVPSPHPPPKIP